MDTMEINKIVGGLVGALLIYLGVQFLAEGIYHHGEGHGDEHDYAYSLEIEEEAEAEPEEEVTFDAVFASADAAKGEKVWSKCRACHKLDGTDGTGPHLNGVVGRDLSAVAGFSYSGSLVATGAEAWTPETLNAFLENPKKWAPGTKMAFAGLRKIQDRANLIAYLETTE